jgi:mono/diheme cytochrome c family protein
MRPPPTHPHLRHALLLATVLAGACAGERAHPEAGEVLYRRYCAACHGIGGRGDGPAARTLSPPPTDLTGLTATVPELMELIDGRRAVPAHGSASMPVWGEIFEQSLISEPHARRTALLQVQTLADYVQALGRREP